MPRFPLPAVNIRMNSISALWRVQYFIDTATNGMQLGSLLLKSQLDLKIKPLGDMPETAEIISNPLIFT